MPPASLSAGTAPPHLPLLSPLVTLSPDTAHHRPVAATMTASAPPPLHWSVAAAA